MQKIIIFTSPGGGGHMSASNALATYLKDDYEVIQVYLLADVLKYFDPIYLASFGKCSGEAAYNAITPYNQWWLLNLIYRIGRICFVPFEPFMRKRIMQYLKDTNADMVISVIPIFNKIILQAAQELDIPFLLMPTDLDIRSFVYNVQHPSYNKFHLSLIFNDYSIVQHAYDKGICDHYITYEGFPLRPEFFEVKSRDALKAAMGIEKHKPVVMVMMGSQGASSIVHCVRHIKGLQTPLHLLVCIGKLQTIKSALASIMLPPWITMDIIEETNRISDYMAVSDILITKSGTASFCEAIHMNLPMILDATSSSLVWERFNHKFTESHGLGAVIKNYAELPLYLEQYLQDPGLLAEVRHNISLLPLKDTPERVRNRIARMLRPSLKYGNLMFAYGKKSRLQ